MTEGTPAAPQTGGSSQMMIMMMMFMTMFIMFIEPMRNAVGGAAWVVLYPMIGLDSKYPVITLFMAGLVMVLLTTVIRHYFIDWVSSAKNQAMMKDFNKELRDSRMAQNDKKVTMLMAKQPEIMKINMESSMAQMKPMAFTMIFIIATFTFLGVFVNDLSSSMFSVPWNYNVDFQTSIVCAFQNWIFVYMLISLSFGQVLQRMLKLVTFSKRLKEMDEAGV